METLEDKYHALNNLRIIEFRNFGIGSNEKCYKYADLYNLIHGIVVYQNPDLEGFKIKDIVQDIDLIIFNIKDRNDESALSFLEINMKLLQDIGLPQKVPLILHYQKGLRPDTGTYSFSYKLEEDVKYDEPPFLVLKHLADELLIICKKLFSKGLCIFISYSWQDKKFAIKLANDLRTTGVRVWFDDDELKLGDSLIQRIREGIDNVDYVAVLLSSASVNSIWVQKEVDIAMNQEIEGKKVKVLPLLLENVELPWFLKGKLFADFRDISQYQKGLKLILQRMGL